MFALASVTKPLVVRAAQVAVEEGGESRHPSRPRPAPRSVLLAHTSGLACIPIERWPAPGTRRMYSNYGSTVLAERAAGLGIEFGRY